MEYHTLVGSREIEYYEYQLLRLAGEVCCLAGYRGRSGLAPGADTAGYEGAQLSTRFPEIGFDNYLPDATMFFKESFRWRKPDPDKGIYDATTFTDTYERAKALALEARGSFNGLYENGIKLHTRNAYQVLGETLEVPSKFLTCWAIPVGKTGRVKGGTNTAVVLAMRNQIPVRNMWYPQHQASLLTKAVRIADQLSGLNQRSLERCLATFRERHKEFL